MKNTVKFLKFTLFKLAIFMVSATLSAVFIFNAGFIHADNLTKDTRIIEHNVGINFDVWIEAGIFPEFSKIEQYATFVTYGEFADIIQALINMNLPEKYSHPLIENQHIAYDEVLEILSSMLGLRLESEDETIEIEEETAEERELITFVQVMEIFDSFIGGYLNTSRPASAEFANLRETLIINLENSLLGANTVWLENIRINSDIIISSASPYEINDSIISHNSAFLRNYTGNGKMSIIDNVKNAYDSRFHMGITNSRLDELNLYINSDIYIFGASRIGNINLNASSSIFSERNSENRISIENINVNSHGVRLSGNFMQIKTSVLDNVIEINGRIETLVAYNSVIIRGNVEIKEMVFMHDEGEEREIIIEILDPDYGRLVYDRNGLRNPISTPEPEPLPVFNLPTFRPPVFTPPPVVTPVPTPRPTPPPEPTPPPPIAPPGQFAIEALSVTINPPNLTNPVIREIEHENFIVRIVWINSATSQIFLGNRFARNIAYMAIINIHPKDNFYFEPELNMDIISERFDIFESPIVLYDRISFNMHFEPTFPLIAEEFFIRDIVTDMHGNFSEIIIETEYLGDISTDNFLIYYNDFINPIPVISVSSFFDGHYVLLIPNQVAGLGELHIRMLGELPYHIPWSLSAYTIPQAPDIDDDENQMITISPIDTTEGSNIGSFIIQNIPEFATHYIILDDANQFISPFFREGMDYLSIPLLPIFSSPFETAGKNGGILAFYAIEDGEIIGYGALPLDNTILRTPQIPEIYTENAEIGGNIYGDDFPNFPGDMDLFVIMSENPESPEGTIVFMHDNNSITVPNDLMPGEYFIFLYHFESGTWSRSHEAVRVFAP
ncbi:MAG: hypothetical protein FWD01_01365 [Defluviitaleaceae bacterium]|nr:hypothetical protein [Defluviitaleaceae bacterium]